jgi:hypothetical protein
MVVLARDQEKEIRTLFNTHQLLRLEQISLQARGPAAFHDPKVTAALALTVEQRSRIRLVETDLFLDSADRFHSGASPESGWKSHQKTMRASLRQIEDLLTPEQRKSWKAMIGDPVPESLLLPPLPPGPFGPPLPWLEGK